MQRSNRQTRRVSLCLNDPNMLHRLREERTRTGINPDVQLLLKQGQVEVDPGNFIPDFRDSVLIHRSVIEDLNATIKVSCIVRRALFTGSWY